MSELFCKTYDDGGASGLTEVDVASGPDGEVTILPGADPSESTETEITIEDASAEMTVSTDSTVAGEAATMTISFTTT